MNPTFEKMFRAPYSVPNGIQDTADGIWVADQVSDRLALMRKGEKDEYGVLWMIREIPTESSNTSGLTLGDGALWVAANGDGSKWREARPSDAKSGEILKVDPETGHTLDRFELSGGGGTHGVEYDPFEPGTLWLTTLKSQTLTQIRISDGAELRVLPLLYGRAHGVVRVEDGIWVVHTGDRVIVKLGVEGEGELDRIDVPLPNPEPHGLSACDDGFFYCDATSGWVVKIRCDV
jgi:streptogramin lyase